MVTHQSNKGESQLPGPQRGPPSVIALKLVPNCSTQESTDGRGKQPSLSQARKSVPRRWTPDLAPRQKIKAGRTAGF